MLRLENVTCGYNSKAIIKDISFMINEGEIVGIIGPNGSGKTTLLRAVTRLLKLKKGLILFEGRDMMKMTLNELARKAAVVSQCVEPGFIKVEDFILLGRIPHFAKGQFLETKNDLRMAEKCMVLTQTTALKNRFVKELSAGERQMVYIARALAQEPKLLILDEPTTHLDISHQAGVLDLVKRLNKEFKLTVIMVLHDLNLAGEYCQRLVLINNGHIHKIGQPQEVLQYQIIEEVYKTVVVVEKNPISSRPYVLLVSEELKAETGCK